jgi:hypothetical protein
MTGYGRDADAPAVRGKEARAFADTGAGTALREDGVR